MRTILQVKKDKTIGDLQYDFSMVYPFLKIEVYRYAGVGAGADNNKQRLNKNILLATAGITEEGELEIPAFMTVGQLERTFRDRFGLSVQVSRKSGTVWLETTMTDSWTLKRQNVHGRELSASANEKIENDNTADA